MRNSVDRRRAGGPPLGRKRQGGGKTGVYKMKSLGTSLVIQGVMYKKRGEKKTTDAVSYYKPHPHLKCPHMRSVLKLSLFPFSDFLQEVFRSLLFFTHSRRQIHPTRSLNVTSFSCSFEKSKQKVLQKIKCSNHISCSTITYTVYIYKYIHKYLTCTTNF